ncbi:MAG: MFS transporter [Thermomicrobiales bacterium]
MTSPRDPSLFRRFSPGQLRNPLQEWRWPPKFSGGIMLAMAGLAIFMSGPGQTYGVSAFVDPMLTELGESRSLFSTAYSIGTLVSALTLLAVGRQIDRFGSRKVLALAAIVFGLALFFMSAVGGVVTLVIGFSLLRASGQGVLTLAARTLVPHWFVRRRGRAFSIIGLAATLSLAAVPLFSGVMIANFGWREAWRINGAIILLGLAPLLWFVVRDRPESIGQHPDGIPPDPALPRVGGEEHGHSLKQAMRTPAFWALIGAGLVPPLVFTGLSFNQVAILTDRGLPATLAATTFTVESLIGLPITLTAGALADRFPLRFTLAAGQAFLALAMVVLLAADNTALALVYAALRGVAGGFWGVAADVAWPSYFGRRHLGSIRGFGTSMGIAGAALGPIPFGLAYDMLGGYNPAIIGLLALPVLGALAVLLTRAPRPVLAEIEAG